MSATLDDTLQEGRDRALARATRALLRHPLLRHGADADALRLVRQHDKSCAPGSIRTPAGACTSTARSRAC